MSPTPSSVLEAREPLRRSLRKVKRKTYPESVVPKILGKRPERSRRHATTARTSSSKRTPRKLTDNRKEKIERFVRSNSTRYGSFGSDPWIARLIRDMGETRYQLEPSDVKAWLRTSPRFFSQLLKQYHGGSTAKAVKTAPPPPPDSYSDESAEETDADSSRVSSLFELAPPKKKSTSSAATTQPPSATEQPTGPPPVDEDMESNIRIVSTTGNANLPGSSNAVAFQSTHPTQVVSNPPSVHNAVPVQSTHPTQVEPDLPPPPGHNAEGNYSGMLGSSSSAATTVNLASDIGAEIEALRMLTRQFPRFPTAFGGNAAAAGTMPEGNVGAMPDPAIPPPNRPSASMYMHVEEPAVAQQEEEMMPNMNDVKTEPIEPPAQPIFPAPGVFTMEEIQYMQQTVDAIKLMMDRVATSQRPISTGMILCQSAATILHLGINYFVLPIYNNPQ